MWIGLLCLLATMAYTFYLKKQKKSGGFTGKRWTVVYLIELLGLALSVGAGLDDLWNGSGRLAKNEPGEGSYTQELQVSSGIYEGEVSLEVPERQVSEREAKEMFLQAEEEIDKAVADGQGAEGVTEDLQIADAYADGTVKARWEFSDDAVAPDGTISWESVGENAIVTATVSLSCGPYEEIYEFPFSLCAPDVGSRAGFERWLRAELERQDSTKGEWILPESVSGESLQWKKEGENGGAALSVLGLASMIAIPLAEKTEQKKEKKKKEERLRRDYPSILSKLVMFLGAGIGLPESVGRIAEDYVQRQRKRGIVLPGYDLLWQLRCELADGIGEQAALEHFGNAAGIKEYRKLSLLLRQNQKKGGSDLLLRLESEETEAQELRKRMAVKLGEEASTKMLLPLMGMLAVVVVIVIAPALMKMQGMG